MFPTLKFLVVNAFFLNTKDNWEKFDAKSYEAIFVGYSNTSKAYRVFNKTTLTIEDSINVKFEESNTFMKNVVEIDSLGEDMEKITLKDSPIEKRKVKDWCIRWSSRGWSEANTTTFKGLEICFKSSQGPHHRWCIQGGNYSFQTPWFMLAFCFYFTHWTQIFLEAEANSY